MYMQVSEELMKLRREQEELESKTKLRVIGLSLFDTVLQVQCISSYKEIRTCRETIVL